MLQRRSVLLLLAAGVRATRLRGFLSRGVTLVARRAPARLPARLLHPLISAVAAAWVAAARVAARVAAELPRPIIRERGSTPARLRPGLRLAVPAVVVNLRRPLLELGRRLLQRRLLLVMGWRRLLRRLLLEKAWLLLLRLLLRRQCAPRTGLGSALPLARLALLLPNLVASCGRSTPRRPCSRWPPHGCWAEDPSIRPLHRRIVAEHAALLHLVAFARVLLRQLRDARVWRALHLAHVHAEVSRRTINPAPLLLQEAIALIARIRRHVP